MKNSTIIGILFTILLGTLLHFTYEWSGNNRSVALFSAVNESTWEHLKLLFFPYLIYTLLEYYYVGHKYPYYFTAKAIGVLCGLIAIPIIFNTYTAILGTNYLVLDILTFIIAVILAYVVSYILLQKNFYIFPYFGITILLLLMLAFFIFTFLPPKCNLFAAPITNSYGID